MSMISVCLHSDALLQHLPSYLGFSYLGCGLSLHGCSSKTQPLLLTLDERYLLTIAVPDLQRGMAPLGPPVPAQTNSQKICPFHYRGLEYKVGSQETPGVTGKFGFGMRNEAGQRLIEFCQENPLVIANILFNNTREVYT